MTEEVKAERDSPGKVRTDLTKRIEELEAKLAQSNTGDVSDLLVRLDQLTNAIVESAHIMGWPKDLLEANGLKAFDKKLDKLSIKQ